mmetsp:Transcript_34282/g.48713  ORF Transcript_34282/g.48713 Transcript_34282/m.48713 type:complete len:123 (-) Transcript_34282:96-464(-)
MTMFPSSWTTQSTIYKRHQQRHPDAKHPLESSFSLPETDSTVTETLSKLQKRSTIYHLHQQRHMLAGSPSSPCSQVNLGMKAAPCYSEDTATTTSLWGVLAGMASHSSIHKRNERRQNVRVW